jgi:hypothetical protein
VANEARNQIFGQPGGRKFEYTAIESVKNIKEEVKGENYKD